MRGGSRKRRRSRNISNRKNKDIDDKKNKRRRPRRHRGREKNNNVRKRSRKRNKNCGRKEKTRRKTRIRQEEQDKRTNQTKTRKENAENGISKDMMTEEDATIEEMNGGKETPENQTADNPQNQATSGKKHGAHGWTEKMESKNNAQGKEPPSNQRTNGTWPPDNQMIEQEQKPQQQRGNAENGKNMGEGSKETIRMPPYESQRPDSEKQGCGRNSEVKGAGNCFAGKLKWEERERVEGFRRNGGRKRRNIRIGRKRNTPNIAVTTGGRLGRSPKSRPIGRERKASESRNPSHAKLKNAFK